MRTAMTEAMRIGWRWAAGLVFAAGVLAASGARAEQAPDEARRDAVPPWLSPVLLEHLNSSLSVTASTVQTLTLPPDSPERFAATIRVDGNTWTLDLHRHSLRAPDFQVLVQWAEGEPPVPTETPAVMTYRGEVREIPGAVVTASLKDGRLTAQILRDEGDIVVQPLSKTWADASPGAHVAFRAADAAFPAGAWCGTTDAPRMMPGLPRGAENPGPHAAGTGLSTADLAIDSDSEFYQDNGANVAAAVLDIETVMNTVAARYEVAAIQITYELTTLIIRTVQGPYTSTVAGTLLCQFRTEWNATFPTTLIRRDTAHLFTGKSLQAPILGVAWVGVLCNEQASAVDCPAFGNLAYGLSWSTFSPTFNSRVAVTAHELGHNWNALHCDGCVDCAQCCRIMCSGVGGCTGINTSFGCREINEIVAFKATRACVQALPTALTLPFSEQFPSGTFDSTKWTYIEDAQITTTSVNPPSATRTLTLNTAGGSLHQEDDVRSNFMQLSGQSGAVLSYWTEHRGVENGEQLVVEYAKNTLGWAEINRITSTGVDQSNFVFHSHSLPANALHNEFRLRFRTEGSDTGDNWHVDDINIASGIAPTVTLDPVSQTVCELTAVNMSVAATGTAPLSYQWRKNGMDIGGATSSSYSIPSTNATHSGPYTCLVTNALGSDLSAVATLAVVTHSSCQDAFFCNGVEFCMAGACQGTGNPCSGTACNDTANNCVAPGTMSCVLSRDYGPAGGNVRLDVMLNNVVDLRSFQTTVTITPTGGTGTMSVPCPGGVTIDDVRSDYVFFGLADIPASNCGALVATSALSGTQVHFAGQTKYLASYALNVSPDADLGSTFDLAIDADPAASYLRNSGNFPITFTAGSACTFTVSCLYGDVDSDLFVNAVDALCVLDGFAGMVNPPCNPALLDLAPCGGDGFINSDDVLAVLNAFAGEDPCCAP